MLKVCAQKWNQVDRSRGLFLERLDNRLGPENLPYAYACRVYIYDQIL